MLAWVLVHSAGTVTTMKSDVSRVVVGDMEILNWVGWLSCAEVEPVLRMAREAVVMRLGLELIGGVRV